MQVAYESAVSESLHKNVVVGILGTLSDQTLIDYCKDKKLEAFFTDCDENDLQKRYLIAAKSVDATHIIRWTSDCHSLPCLLIEPMIQAFKDGYDYASNTIFRTYPEGMDLQGSTVEFFEWAAKHKYASKEHPYSHVDMNLIVRKQAAKAGYKIMQMIDQDFNSLIKFGSIDTQEDLERMRNEFDIFKTKKTNFGMAREVAKSFSSERKSGNELKKSDTIH